MALGVKLKSSKKSTTMVKKRKPTNTTSTNKFKNKEEREKTDDVKFHHMKNKSDVKEGYELRKMRERVDLHRKKILSERNFRKKPSSSNLGFNENDLQTVKKFHNRVYDKGTGENQRLGGRIDRQNKNFEGEFDFKNQNLRGRFDSKNANCKGEFDSKSENFRGRFDSKNEKIKRVGFKNENLSGRFDSKNENLRRVDFKNENFRGRFDSKNENIRRVDFKNENLRRVDSKIENLRGRVDSKNENLKEENENQNSKLKFRRLPSRVLDKTGRKIRVSNKRELKKGPGEKNAQKKRKRVIKLDPCDGSNKRFDDIIPPPKEDIEKKDENEISKNAQFRAIIPSTSILSFVEENLLGRRRLIELTNGGYNVKISSPLDNVPFTTCKEREKIEEPVFRNKLEFFAAAKVSSSFPPPVIPEIAFAGRSNVGKSSLLNSLTRQWGVVRTSDKPGLTQTINFFRLASKLSLVDLPGYGFAYAKDEVKDAWEDLVKEYVSTRVGLQRVCLLIDTKWGMKPRDHELIDLMERSQTPYQIVLTKTDIVFPIDVARRAMQIQESLKKNKSVINPLMMVSSKSGGGIRNLRSVLANLGRFIKP